MSLEFDEHYRETLALRDGRLVTLRCIRPDDKELLRRGFERLSPESRYRRFLSSKKRLSDEELVYLTEVDGIDHFALGATACDADGGECGVAIARFVRSRDDPFTAEPAIAVADDWQRDGLGTLLLRRLVAAALERGILRFQGMALAGNAPILDVLAPLGSEARLVSQNGEVSISVDLPAVPESWPRGRKATVDQVLALVAKGFLAMATRLRTRRPVAEERRSGHTPGS